MNDAKNRVLEELYDLGDKLSKLSKFICSEEFMTLSREMQYLMCDQMRTMIDYSNILRRRHQIWDKTDEELDNCNAIMK